MGDRNQVRDRTLVLRVLVPSLQTRLRDKMKEAAEQAPASGKTFDATKETLVDLDGVACEPTKDGSTLWNFHCDGATYPARLVNLPCPVELHKTHDHAMYYKSADVAQALIVYEDRMAMEEAEAASGYTIEGFPSYYHSGLTPPMKRVVERRFAAREHKAVAPPPSEVRDVERELKQLIERISKDSTKSKGKSKAPSLSSAHHANKVIEEVVDEVVDYESWMDDQGRAPYGVEFDENDHLCTKHPDLWLNPEEVAIITKTETEKADAIKKKKAEKKQKEGKKKSKKKPKEEEPETKGPSAKKGIPAKKSMEVVDPVTQIAAQMSQTDNTDDMELDLEGLGFNFGDDDQLTGDDDLLAGMKFD